MARRIIVELEPSGPLATASLDALTRLSGTHRERFDRAAVAADAVAAAEVPEHAGFRLDASFPPTPVPRPTVTPPDTPGITAALTGSHAFDVRRRLTVDLDPLATPYIVRGEIDDEDQAQALTAQPNVRAVYSDPFIRPCLVCPGSPPVGTDRDVERLSCVDKLKAAGMDGRGVLIAIVDTGINLAHLQSCGKNPRVDRTRSWVPAGVDDEPSNFPADHGTMCAYDALIAAPRATLLDVAVLLSQQSPQPGESPISGLLSDAVLAYSHLLSILQNPSRRPGEAVSLVVSNSWAIFSPAWDFPPGHVGNYTDNPEHPFNRIVATLESFGADILFAAGNCGTDCPDGRCEWPDEESTIAGANSHPAVLSVGGVDVTGERVGYSSTGPGRIADRKPDVSGFTHFEGSGVYAADGGTSAACPVVAGVVAAVRSRLPSTSGKGSTSPAAVRDMLCKTALERGNPGYDYAYGWGIVHGCRLSEIVPEAAPDVSSDDAATAVSRLEANVRGVMRTTTAPSAEGLTADTGKRTEVVAHLMTGEDIESAVITTVDNPNGTRFKGSARDQNATVSADSNGRLVWGLDLETQMPFAAWSLTLTKKGEEEGSPDEKGTTDGRGVGGGGGIKKL